MSASSKKFWLGVAVGAGAYWAYDKMRASA